MAASVLFSIGLGLPFCMKFLMKIFGANFFNCSYLELVGIYGYSFTSFIITAAVCAIPNTDLQWLLVAYSAITSGAFLMVSFWNDLKSTLEQKRRTIVIGIVCAV